MTDEELVAKFSYNAEGIIPAAGIDRVVSAVMDLENVADIGTLMSQVRKGA